ncbi:coagulation factor XIII B chain-like isoform X1 [Dreissena polymorpha]|uniref:coagulation factor XIII B chain-like isoform X1 n=1 Tax=Dreissena polymorpha TaxID=45954 RepID=UPI00226552BD|nr:coagulation factor XIII B chain-like isoform X1 [Dreissena polymorpha]
MDMTFLLKCLIVYCITFIFVDHLTTGQQDSCSDCTRFEMRKDLSCHVVLKYLRTTDVATCMRDCTDDCHGLLFNELERNCTLCASVKIETGNPDKKATAFEKVKKKCGYQTPSDSTKTSQKLCPPFENKKNGKVVGESLLEGATKNLTCHPGYSPRDRNNVVSQCKNSQWTKITECAIVCPTFENINNGKVEGDTLFEGATRNLTCNPGYSPRDSNAVLSLCQNGQWTKKTECIKDCPPFENNSKGNVTGDSLVEGATRNLTCDIGYSPRDGNIVVSRCQNAHWTSITECVRVCPPFENNSKGNVTGDSLFEGATRNLTCDTGYSPRDDTIVVSQCQNGHWTNITECVKVCPPFENNSKGNVTGDSLFEGATRNLTCDAGYSPRDDHIIVSQCQNGHWTNITECVKVCPPFENNSKGNVTGDSLFEGATRNLTCDAGYSPRDDKILVSRCQNGHWTNITECVQVKDCTELLNRDSTKLSGVYTIITPVTHTKVQVFCDMEKDGGGWTVFQKRFDGSEDFYRNFNDYEKGFGTVYAEHWLGLKYIYEMTSLGSYQLRVDIVRSNGSKGYDVYGGFSLQPGTNYTLNVGSRVRSNGRK